MIQNGNKFISLAKNGIGFQEQPVLNLRMKHDAEQVLITANSEYIAVINPVDKDDDSEDD